MQTLIEIFGKRNDLTVFNMFMRTVLIFIIALILIRISGRRAFGMHMPMDNVITILLGALLSRAIVGVAPFVGTIVSAFSIVVLYRICALLAVFSKTFGKLVKGKELLIYKDGLVLKENMKKAMVTEKDLNEEIRINIHRNSLENIDAAYLERNGKISVVEKSK